MSERTCRDIVEMISDYLEGALPASERAHVEEHLASCDGCAMALDQVRMTIDLLGRLDEERITPAQREALRGVFHRHLAG